MRNLKKVLAVILTVAMLASLMVPAFAAVSNLEEAKKLQAIGLFAGGEADLKLDEDVTRIQGLTFAIRAAGKEDEALAMTDEEVAAELAKFNDAADIPSWNGNGPKYVAYAIKNGITVGDGQGNFKPLDKVSGRAFLVFLLKSGMGYADVTTLTAPDVAVDAGVLTPGQAISFGLAEDGIIRDDAAAILYGAAMNGENEDGQKFIDALIESGFVDEKDAIKAGFKKDPDAEKLAVKDVEVLNLLQVAVTFNKDVTGNDDVEDRKNYWFENDKGKDLKFDHGSGDGEAVEVVDVRVVDNVAILTVGFEDANDDLFYFFVDNQTEAVLKIDEDVTGKELDFDVEFEDFDIPEVEDAEVIGKDDIKVTFSEPIWEGDRSNFKVESADGKTSYRVTRVRWAKAMTEAFVEVGKDFKDGDEVVLKIDNKLEDCASFNVKAQEFDLVVDEDNRDIEVVDYRNASEEGVTLILNKPVEFKGTAKASDFYHTNKADTADHVIIDGNEIKIEFKTHKLPAGTAYVTIKSEALVDLWDNENDTIRVEIDVDADTTAPAVKDIKVENGRTIIVEFDQELDKKSAEDEDNYVILDADYEETDEQVRSATLGGTGDKKDKIVTLRLNGKLSTGNYFIEIDGVKDLNENATDELTEEFEVEGGALDLDLDPAGDVELSIYVDNDNYDKAYGSTDGTEKNGEFTEYTINIDFNRAMETGDTRYSIENLDNYAVRFTGDSKLYTLAQLAEEGNYDVDLYVNKDDKGVEIVIEIDKDEEHHKLSELVISRVADKSGVLSEQTSKSYTITDAMILTEAERVGVLDIKEVKAIDNETVEVKFNKDIDDLEAEDFIIATVDSGFKLTGSIRLGSDDDKIIIELDREIKDDATYEGEGLKLIVLPDPETSSIHGEKMPTAGLTKPVTDGINPEFDADRKNPVDGHEVTTGASVYTIRLYFTEAVTGDALAIASTLDIEAGDDALSYTAGAVTAGKFTVIVPVSGDYIDIQVAAADADTEDIDIEFRENNGFTDVAGNNVLDFNVYVFTADLD